MDLQQEIKRFARPGALNLRFRPLPIANAKKESFMGGRTIAGRAFVKESPILMREDAPPHSPWPSEKPRTPSKR